MFPRTNSFKKHERAARLLLTGASKSLWLLGATGVYAYELTVTGTHEASPLVAPLMCDTGETTDIMGMARGAELEEDSLGLTRRGNE